MTVAPTPMSWGDIQLSQIPAQAASNANPSNLTPWALNYYGAGAHISVESAYNTWSGQKNPFIELSPEWTAFIEYKQYRDNKEKAKYLKLPEVTPEIRPSKRRVSMPRFKPEFDTLHDIRLRLNGTLIFVGSRLYYVHDIRDLDGDFLMLLEDEGAIRCRAWYKKEGTIDLRSPEPQYFVYDGKPAYLVRWPNRQQQQGVNANVVSGKFAGSAQFFRVHNVHQLMQTLGGDTIVWDGRLYDLMMKARAMPAIRLSKDVSFFSQKKEVMCEYRGRVIGEVKDDTVCVDDCDYRRPWIVRDINQVGCKLKVS